jgi:non-ribosomal peptide synthetase component E (peptide arylation enzyme)
MEVVGVADQRLGVKLVLVHGEEISHEQAEACMQEMNDGAPGYERLQEVLVVDNVPRTEIGKVDWPRLRRMLGDG